MLVYLFLGTRIFYFFFKEGTRIIILSLNYLGSIGLVP